VGAVSHSLIVMAVSWPVPGGVLPAAVVAGVVVAMVVMAVGRRLDAGGGGRSGATMDQGWLGGLGVGVANRLPATYVQGLRQRLVRAGSERPEGVHVAIGVRLLAVVGAAATFVVAWTLGGGGPVAVVGGAVVAAGVAGAPELVLRQRTRTRAAAMRGELPRQLDLLIISVEAGLGFDQSLDRVVAAMPGPLATEFARMQAGVRAGMARTDAMRLLVERCPVPEVRSFALAMIQAETFGVSIGPVLRTQAEELRIRHRQSVQLQAQKAPVKMLMPMVLCIFPALLVVVAGPALLSVRSVFPS